MRTYRSWFGCTVGVVLLGILLPASFIAGGIYREYLFYQERSSAQAVALSKVINKRPEFQNLRIIKASDGWAYLAGTVPSSENLEQLRREALELGGKEYAKDCVDRVEVSEGK